MKRITYSEDLARSIQHWGEQDPRIHNAEMKRWRAMWAKEKQPLRESLKEAGYEYVGMAQKGCHVLREIATGRLEMWCANKNHASYGLVYKNTHLEFCYSI